MKWICRNCQLSNENFKRCKKCGAPVKIIDLVEKHIAGWEHRAPAFLRKQRQTHKTPNSVVSSVPSQSIHDPTQDFVLLGGGGYTIAILCHVPDKYGIGLRFKSGAQYGGGVVLRLAGDTSVGRSMLESPQRVSDLFNQINNEHDIPQAQCFTIPKAVFVTMVQTLDSSDDPRWRDIRQHHPDKLIFVLAAASRQIAVTPFITGVIPATDEQLCDYTIKNFIKYRRILLDAFNSDNVMQPTVQSNVPLNPNELVTLDVGAFFEIFQTDHEKTYLPVSTRRRSYTSAFWVQHKESDNHVLAGGVLLKSWIMMWLEHSAAVPITTNIVLTLLTIAYVDVDLEALLAVFDHMQNNIHLISDFLFYFLRDAFADPRYQSALEAPRDWALEDLENLKNLILQRFESVTS